MYMRSLLTTLPIVLLLLASAFLLGSSNANPVWHWYTVESPVETAIQFTYPTVNNTLYSLNKLNVAFDANITTAGFDVYITQVYYSTSWRNGNVTIYQLNSDLDPHISEYSGNLTLTEIPQGNQSVSVTVLGYGWYSGGLDRYLFHPKNTATLNFTVDTVAPTVTLQQLNATYMHSDIPINITANEPISAAAYCLDGEENVTITPNWTLSALATGPHNVTIYAWDAAGNVGKSETVFFTVAESEEETAFSAELLIAITAALIIIACCCTFLVLWKRRSGTATSD
jgi:hypothetical protein